MTEHTRPRIYGTDHDSPDPHTTLPGHEYVELSGGPLDGQLLDVTGLTDDERTAGAYLITPHSTYGPGGRASYGPTFTRPNGPWVWEGDAP
ncbi:hypothetical protein AB0D56_32690 [Streptomyces sp. NPDC048209]|uniref:hypothetical protein n=1 Tax=unclassified Streptomyces TaxID=2593676 RepID=UPI0029B4AB66|nr:MULTISPECIES: hypothetical protein [unclassified Streptomyces]MDX3186163.1 hypothetical protein [Streptomyces sp. ME02-7008A-1]MDX3307098.1 hypothetical protein [Streptomyces sp. ME02-7008A]